MRSRKPKSVVSNKSMPHAKVYVEPVADVKGEIRLLHSDVGLMSWIEGVVVFITLEVFEDGGEAGQEELRLAVKTSLA